MTEPTPLKQVEMTTNGTTTDGNDISSDDDIPTNCSEFFKDLFKQENDLAGFNIIWALGTVVLIILKISNDPYMEEAGWGSILFLPIIISILTWIFSYAISKYRRDNSVEAMNKRRFLIPLFLKMFLTTFLFARYLFAKGGLFNRFRKNEKWNDWCSWSLIAAFVSYFLATLTTEIMITTVMVNSSQNMKEDISTWWKVFLFIARPTLWIYNRIIVMFITYYSFYIVTLGVGPICASQCQIEPAKLHTLGVVMLLQPISSIIYLFKFGDNFSFNLTKFNVIDESIQNWRRYDQTNADELMLAVIQQTLLAATIIDLCISFWSLYKILKARRKSGKIIKKVPSNNRISSQTPVPLKNGGSESHSLNPSYQE